MKSSEKDTYTCNTMRKKRETNGEEKEKKMLC